ncbi:hypothetical protein [Gimesia sp.]|uniref:hypothetical protein n=1 Tax=Gimesia sp. TaxID=2024833 RepID=UPI003A925F42
MSDSKSSILLSIHELNAVVSLSITTIRRRIREGTIPAIQPGGKGTKLLIPVEWLQKWSALSQASPEQTTSTTNAKQRKTISGPRPRWMK